MSMMCLHNLIGHAMPVNAFALNNVGHLVSASLDSTLRIWNLSLGTCLFTLRGHTDAVYSVAVLDSGAYVSGSKDGSLRFWDTSMNAPHLMYVLRQPYTVH